MAEKTPEQDAAIRAIRKLMAFWHITPDELHVPRAEGAAKPPAAPPPPATPKYRHPLSGETWDGVGRQPDWLRLALTKEGYMVEELRISDMPPPQ
jgi:DNA-binding protein H-NS